MKIDNAMADSLLLRSAAMDKEILEQEIANMLKELRDRAIGDRENDVFYINWKFIEDVDSVYRFDHYQITKRYKDNGGLLSKWKDTTLEDLHRGLTDRRVRAVALDEEKQILGESSAWDSPKKPIAKRIRLPNKLRERLIEEIETAIGRELDPRSARIIDPRRSDSKPPNLYKWQFSKQYPGFPDKKGGISRWQMGQIQACYEALDKKHLIVVNVDPESAEALKSPEVEEVVDSDTSKIDKSLIAPGTAQESLLILMNSPTPLERPAVPKNSTQSLARDVIDQMVQFLPDPIAAIVEEHQVKVDKGPFKGLEGAQSQILNILSTLLEDETKELEDRLEARHVVAHTQLQEALEETEQKLQAEIEAHRKTLSNLLPLQREGEKLRTKVAKLERDISGRIKGSQIEEEKLRANIRELEQVLEQRVSLARIEGRKMMNDELSKDLNDIMEGERVDLRRNHIVQLVKVRAESYELGVLAGRKEAEASSTPAQGSQDTPYPTFDTQVSESQSATQQTSQVPPEASMNEFSQKSHGIFNHDNEVHLATRNKITAPGTALTTAVTPIPDRKALMKSDRPLLGSTSNPPKRPNTSSTTLAAQHPKRRKTVAGNAMPAQVQDLYLLGENILSSGKNDDTTIHVDYPERVQDVSTIAKNEGGEDEDIYNATPPHRTRRRAGTKKIDDTWWKLGENHYDVDDETRS